MSFLLSNLPLVLSGFIVFVGLAIFGPRDLVRFSIIRTWAVGSLTFREGIRRRVLWTMPLAMIAALFLIILADPADERQAMSQAIQSLLFASGLMAILVPLVLGCTSFPREIENRILYGVVTKPVTRLELLLGKIVGLARLLAVALVVMGVFSLIVLLILEARLVGTIKDQLAGVLPDESRRPYLTHVVDDGLLSIAGSRRASDFQFYAEPPQVYGDDTTASRFFPPNNYFAAVPFTIPADEAVALSSIAAEGKATVVVQLRLDWHLLEGEQPPGSLPIGVQNPNNLPALLPPLVGVDLRTVNYLPLRMLDGIANNVAQLPVNGRDVEWDDAAAIVLPDDVAKLIGDVAVIETFHIGIWGRSSSFAYGIAPDSVRLLVVTTPDITQTFGPYLPAINPGETRSKLLLRTHFGSGGQGLRGPGDGYIAPYGVFAYRGFDAAAGETVGFELAGDAEQDGTISDYLATAVEAGSRTRIVSSDGSASEWKDLAVDTARPGYVAFDADYTNTGDFDLQIQTTARDRFISLTTSSIRMTGVGESFAWTFIKALAAQWLLGVLVATVALVFGTFVSWPVALVLCVAFVGGRSVITSVGESSGRDAVMEVFDVETDSAAAREVVERGYSALSATTQTVGEFLPPTSLYDVSAVVAAREPVSLRMLLGPLLVTLLYGLPVAVIGYIVLKRKEVAA